MKLKSDAFKKGLESKKRNMFHIEHGDNLAILKKLNPNQFDSLVTDPPAGIGFMGKDWDKDKGDRDNWIAWLRDIMREAYRVLKPGAYGVVWSLPRTSHWTAMALEDAGFDIRDCILHVFGQGFPKSQDISKKIDEHFGVEREQFQVNLARDTRITKNSGNAGIVCGICGEKTVGPYGLICGHPKDSGPITPEAKQWNGWGTALKPSFEGWFLVQKPERNEDELESELWYASAEIGALLCQISSAKFVKLVSTSNQADFKEVKLDSVAWLVDALNTLGSIERSEMMAMFKSPETGLTVWNIGLSWKTILEGVLSQRSTFTIKMETVLITELKTLRSLVSVIMRDNTILAEIKNCGWKSNVKIVDVILKDVEKKLICILEHSVPGIAGEIAISSQDLQEKLQGAVKGQRTAPLSECWWLIQKPVSENTIAENVLKHRTGGLNIDGSRIGYGNEKIDFNQRQKGAADRAQVGDFGINSKPQDIQMFKESGRFPANFLMTHSPDCKLVGTKKVKAIKGGGGAKSPVWTESSEDKKRKVYPDELGYGDSDGTETVEAWECVDGCPIKLLDEQSGDLAPPGNRQESVARNNESNIFGKNAKNIPGVNNYPGEKGGASRFFKTFEYDPFFYAAKPSPGEKNEGLEDHESVKVGFSDGARRAIADGDAEYLQENIGINRVKYMKNTHPTVKGIKLMAYLIKLITPPGGVVLDPFMGSGTTGVAAIKNGFKFFGIDQEKQYTEIAIDRMMGVYRVDKKLFKKTRVPTGVNSGEK